MSMRAIRLTAPVLVANQLPAPSAVPMPVPASGEVLVRNIVQLRDHATCN